MANVQSPGIGVIIGTEKKFIFVYPSGKTMSMAEHTTCGTIAQIRHYQCNHCSAAHSLTAAHSNLSKHVSIFEVVLIIYQWLACISLTCLLQLMSVIPNNEPSAHAVNSPALVP